MANSVKDEIVVLSGNEKSKKAIKINYSTLRQAVLVLRAVNHKLRQDIIKLLDKEKKLTVTEIYVKQRLEQSVASQHLAILRKAGVVETEREGKYIFYILNQERLKEIAELVDDLVEK